MIALDCAASEFYVNGKYDYTKFEGETGKSVRRKSKPIIWLNLPPNIQSFLLKMVCRKTTGQAGNTLPTKSVARYNWWATTCS
jgi:hypothetical protein